MYHSLIFFEDFEEFTETSMLDEEVTYTATRLKNPINTWDDFHLVPSTRPVINPPNTRTSEVIIPGRSGSLDLSEVLTGYPLFDNRTGSIEFIVVNGYWNWQVAYSTIMRHLHGKTFKMVLEDDPAYYYEGRFAVNSWKSDKNWSTITIDYNVQPYKLSRQHTSEDWLWDPFSFEDGVVSSATYTVSETEQPAEVYIKSGDNHSHLSINILDTSTEQESGKYLAPDMLLLDTDLNAIQHYNQTVLVLDPESSDRTEVGVYAMTNWNIPSGNYVLKLRMYMPVRSGETADPNKKCTFSVSYKGGVL